MIPAAFQLGLGIPDMDNDMVQIDIRQFVPTDLPDLLHIDHSYHTDFVWQMEVNQEEKEIKVKFKEVRLPRSMRVDYPRTIENIADLIDTRLLTLVATKNDQLVGYISVDVVGSIHIVNITDIAVLRRLRKQGIGSALVLAVQSWLTQKGIHQVQLEMQSKNHPAINLANKLGYEFCGYSDRYYPNQDIALFFGRRV